jgi:hypothetical protein
MSVKSQFGVQSAPKTVGQWRVRSEWLRCREEGPLKVHRRGNKLRVANKCSMMTHLWWVWGPLARLGRPRGDKYQLKGYICRNGQAVDWWSLTFLESISLPLYGIMINNGPTSGGIGLDLPPWTICSPRSRMLCQCGETWKSPHTADDMHSMLNKHSPRGLNRWLTMHHRHIGRHSAKDVGRDACHGYGLTSFPSFRSGSRKIPPRQALSNRRYCLDDRQMPSRVTRRRG